MCTALTLHTEDHYFGRNLDLEYSYHESVAITPRNYPFRFRKLPELPQHYAMIGMAYVQSGYPLYYEATNEMGLSMAGLNFPGFAHYAPEDPGKDNVAPFELIPWLLGQCANLMEVREKLKTLCLAAIPFSDSLPLSPLHWIISDREGSITLEAMADGLHIHANAPGILTNNPPFDYQMLNLANYMGLSSLPPENGLAALTELTPFSRGMGALGLPGDWSSPSRFVRAAYLKANSLCAPGEEASVSQFFHILEGVSHIRGSVQVTPGAYEITVYACCCNVDKGIYYYKTYENSTISAVSMHHEDLESREVISYPLLTQQHIVHQN